MKKRFAAKRTKGKPKKKKKDTLDPVFINAMMLGLRIVDDHAGKKD